MEEKIRQLSTIQYQFLDKQFRAASIITPAEAWDRRKKLFNFYYRTPENTKTTQQFDYSHNPLYNRSLGYFDYQNDLNMSQQEVMDLLKKTNFQQELQQIELDIKNKISQYQKKAFETQAQKQQRIINFILQGNWSNQQKKGSWSNQQKIEKVNLVFSSDVIKECNIPVDKLI